MSVDPRTYARYERSREKADRLGLALSEVLDRDRLLLTEARERRIRVNELESLYWRLDVQSAAKLMRFYYERDDGTPEEMFKAIMQWLDAVIRAVADRTLEE